MSNVSMTSLTPIGTPQSGPRRGLRSRACACASANSGLKLTQALTISSRAAMRSMQSRVTASHVISPAAILATISVAVNSLSRRPTFTSIAWRSVLAGAPGRGTGDLAEHGARYESRAAGIIEIEQAADQFAGGIEAADRLIVGVEHFAIGVDTQAAEGEGDAAGHGVGLERRRIYGVRPIALVDGEPLPASPILDVGIERHVGFHRRIPFFDCR